MKPVTALFFAVAATASLAASALTTGDLVGMPAVDNHAQRTVSIDSNTHITVHQGDIVKLTHGENGVTWQFAGVNSGFRLSKVFSSAPGTESVRVHVNIEPMG